MPRTMTGRRRHRTVNSDSEPADQLRSACMADDLHRVAQLLGSGSVTAEDATECLDETCGNPLLMRMLLEFGADPSVCATTRLMSRSFEMVKLLVEFCYDISINGHWILQYVGTASFERFDLADMAQETTSTLPRSSNGFLITVLTSTRLTKRAFHVVIIANEAVKPPLNFSTRSQQRETSSTLTI